jgi:tetratricopeptide (TPR) repeat protein
MVLSVFVSANLVYSAEKSSEELNFTSVPKFSKAEVIDYKAQGQPKETYYFGYYTSPRWGRKDVMTKWKGKSYSDMWEGNIEARDSASLKTYTGRFIGNLKDGWLKGFFTSGNDIKKGRAFFISAKAENYKIKGKIWEGKTDTGVFEISLLSDAKELSVKEDERIEQYKKTAENSTDDKEKISALGALSNYYIGNNEKKLEDIKKALTYLEKAFKVNKEAGVLSDFYKQIFIIAKKNKDKVLWDKYQKILEQELSETKDRNAKYKLENVKKTNSTF